MLFISYSRNEITGARNLEQTLSSKGVECWRDESNIPVGQAFVAQMGDALRRSDSFLLVDTPASRSSYWVSREVGAAIRYRGSGRYHTLVRIYAPTCECAERSEWEASFPLDAHSVGRITELLAARSAARAATPASGEVSGVSIAGHGLGQPHNWLGRHEDLRHLDQWWFGFVPGAWVQGLGGIGKTGLLQTWISALAYLGYEEPARATVLHVLGREAVETTDAIGRLATWQLRDPRECHLLFLDGYDEGPQGEKLEALVREALRLGTRLVVTSRSPVPTSLLDAFHSIPVHSMQRRDATSLLAEYGVGGPEGTEAASELGDHPLALLLFAQYVASGKHTAAEALRDLNSARLAEPGDILHATLAAAVRTLTSDARRLLEALCAASHLGVVSVAEFPNKRQPAPPETIGELARSGLIQVDHLETPTTIAIHPLVRNFVEEDPRGLLDA